MVQSFPYMDKLSHCFTTYHSQYFRFPVIVDLIILWSIYEERKISLWFDADKRLSIDTVFDLPDELVKNVSRSTKKTKKKTNKMTCASSKDSDQPEHSSCLISFTVRMKKDGILSYPLCAQRRFWLDCADAQADLSLWWRTCHFVGFVVLRLM